MTQLCSRGSKKVSIIGAGMVGLAAAQTFAGEQSVSSIKLYAPYPPGDLCDPARTSCASSLAALLHPYNTRGGLSWDSSKGMHATMKLLQSSQTHHPKGYLTHKSIPVYRPCFSSKALEKWVAAEGCTYISSEELQNITGSHHDVASRPIGGAIHGAVFVNPESYLEGLWAAAADQHSPSEIKFIPCTVDDQKIERILEDADVLVIAAGAESEGLWRTALAVTGQPADILPLPVLKIVGQSIFYPSMQPLLSTAVEQHAVISGEYVIKTAAGLQVGSTHEGYGSTAEEGKYDLCSAWSQLEHRLTRLYPAAFPDVHTQNVSNMKFSRAATRLSSRRSQFGRLPLIVSNKCIQAQRSPDTMMESKSIWLCTAFGSRGYLYHALAAQYMVDSEIRQKPVPKEYQFGVKTLL